MLIAPNSYLYTYTITRDFGFAPNPFHGFCSLATCKPHIRKAARIGDWVMGIGGTSLGAAKRKCIFLMKVTEKNGFQNYWSDRRFSLKKPLRNGSRVQMLGDNIYHKGPDGSWIQEDSHHSNPDGTPNPVNVKRDTGHSDQVLISNYFIYHGSQAVAVDLDSIGYTRIRDFKKTDLSASPEGRQIIETMFNNYRRHINIVIADPCQFMASHLRVDQKTGKTA
ncbi:MAG TPA: hypothetical protein VJ576_01280 [Rhodocyclaceae bacterium]|nr:hypothetical protein [Rhodocyclaceae bacterium]